MRRAFTMVELVFVIVVLGILAAIAVPKLAATRTDAQIAKARSTIAAVRTGIVTERQKRLFRGDSSFINHIDSGVASNTVGVTIFDNNGTADNMITMYGVTADTEEGHWVKAGTDQYDFKVLGKTARFTYYDENGSFDCVDQVGTGLCGDLTD